MASLFSALRKPSVTNQPPSVWEIRRNDLVIILWLALMLLLGLGIRSRVLNASHTLPIGEGLPAIALPSGWSITKAEGLALQAKNLASPSTFDAEIDVYTRDLKENEAIELVHSAWSLKRSEILPQYRELSVENVKVQNDIAGLRTTYAYVADPTRESGASGLPVVVEAQDLLFVQHNKVVVVTMAADAAEWASEMAQFQLVYDSLKLQLLDGDAQGGVQ
ncbi:hypothetical protein BH10CHL1_BH10CHL1_29390 [soil metagenome]